MEQNLTCTVVVGGFWGDEGKGKIISYIALRDEVQIGVRGGVGPNAGHTVQSRGVVYKVRMLPSTFTYDKSRLLIGAGVLVNPMILQDEIKITKSQGKVGVDFNCAIIEDKHIQADKDSKYLAQNIGTTGTGTGPCNMDRVARTVKLAKNSLEIKSLLTDVSTEINFALDEGKNVLVEGTQGTFLSLYHGTYPYTTSKDVTAASICGDVGIGPTRVNDVIVVFKAYITRVGEGPLPGELTEEKIKNQGWLEIGTVTGRQRRAAPFNIELARRAVMLNGATQVAITKLDVIYPEAKEVKIFNDLPKDAKRFIKDVEKSLCVKVTLIGTGPDLSDIIDISRT